MTPIILDVYIMFFRYTWLIMVWRFAILLMVNTKNTKRILNVLTMVQLSSPVEMPTEELVRIQPFSQKHLAKVLLSNPST